MTDTTWDEMLADFRRRVADAYGSHDEDADDQIAGVVRRTLEDMLIKLANANTEERITSQLHNGHWRLRVQEQKEFAYAGNPTHPYSFVEVRVNGRIVSCIYSENPNDPRSHQLTYDGESHRVTSCIYARDPNHPLSCIRTWTQDHPETTP